MLYIQNNEQKQNTISNAYHGIKVLDRHITNMAGLIMFTGAKPFPEPVRQSCSRRTIEQTLSSVEKDLTHQIYIKIKKKTYKKINFKVQICEYLKLQKSSSKPVTLMKITYLRLSYQ